MWNLLDVMNYFPLPELAALAERGGTLAEQAHKLSLGELWLAHGYTRGE
jgi:hypothetical protein